MLISEYESDYFKKFGECMGLRKKEKVLEKYKVVVEGLRKKKNLLYIRVLIVIDVFYIQVVNLLIIMGVFTIIVIILAMKLVFAYLRTGFYYVLLVILDSGGDAFDIFIDGFNFIYFRCINVSMFEETFGFFT